MFRYLKRIVTRRRKEPDNSTRARAATPHEKAVPPWHVHNHLLEIGLRPVGTSCGQSVSPRALSSHRVSVLLNQGEVYAHPGDGYEPLSGYVKAIEFDVDAINATAACEVAYGVTNSYPWELHCDTTYLDVVRTYREVGHFRSVTVGDIFVVDDEQFVCSRFGFARSPGMNGMV